MSKELWYKQAVLYEIYVRAFSDSNGDGIGDIRGLIGKLDYLQQLGVTALWLLPITNSPLRDDGYDVSDYYQLYPGYGNLDDFHLFVEEAHKRDMKVVVELIPNHTSDQNLWFQASRDPQHPEHARYRDWYVWRDDDQGYRDARVIFVDYEPSNWTYDPLRKAYYWHRFFDHQPDLNYDNPEVQEAMLKVVAYWIDQGADGIRVDAPPYLFEREGTNCENLPETHVYLKRLRAFVDSYAPEIMLLSEANQWPEDVRPYFGDGDEFHMNFHFPLMPRIYMALAKQDRTCIDEILARTPDLPESCQWAVFLRCHDELTLEMVTPEERQFMWDFYAAEPRMRLNMGIRRRLAPLLGNHMARIKLANSILLTLIGSPVLYYGDEIGMGDAIELEDRDGVRTPMQWDDSHNAGFSSAKTEDLYNPVIEDGPFSYRQVNVKREENDPGSLLKWTRQILKIRKQYPAFGSGSLKMLAPKNKSVLAYVRVHAAESILVINNISEKSLACSLDLSAFAGKKLVDIFTQISLDILLADKTFFNLAGYEYRWFKLV
jgi:maltose alpha-D-glucosyltransferase / alpha-amylase